VVVVVVVAAAAAAAVPALFLLLSPHLYCVLCFRTCITEVQILCTLILSGYRRGLRISYHHLNSLMSLLSHKMYIRHICYYQLWRNLKEYNVRGPIVT
jgi:hypothetical protein